SDSVHAILLRQHRREIIERVCSVAETGKQYDGSTLASPVEHLKLNAGFHGDEFHNMGEGSFHSTDWCAETGVTTTLGNRYGTTPAPSTNKKNKMIPPASSSRAVSGAVKTSRQARPNVIRTTCNQNHTGPRVVRSSIKSPTIASARSRGMNRASRISVSEHV